MRILKTVHTLNPAAGGVATAVDALTRAELALGHTVEVACFDDPAAPWLANRPYPVHAFPSVRFRSYGWCPALARWLDANLARFDAATVEGLWQYHGAAIRAATRKTGTPYVVYPHGMLDPWFKQAYPYKHLKKNLYWKLGGHRILRDARAVAFTTEEEMRLAQNAFQPWSARSVISPLGVPLPDGNPAERAERWKMRFPALVGKKFLLFLGRVDPKKGVDQLIAAYAAQYPATVRTSGDAPPLVIAGPESVPPFAAQCRRQAEMLGLRANTDIFWTGMLDANMKWAALEAADAMILPSHQENFGYVVAEALAVGTPVLLADKVNLWREVVADGAGAAAPDTQAGAQELLAAYAGWTITERARLAAAALGCFEQRFRIEAAARRQIEVLKG